MRNVPFALNPPQAITGIMDFTKDSNVKLYRKSTSKLSEDLFNCLSEDLLQFLKTLSDRATELSWNDPIVGIIMIPEDPTNVSTVYKNLITNHGEITLERVQRFEEYYTNDPSRAAQNAGMLYSCLMASISKVGKTTIMVWEKQYKINGKGSGNS